MILTDGRRQQHTIEGARANVSGVGGELVRPGPTPSMRLYTVLWRQRNPEANRAARERDNARQRARRAARRAL